MHTNTHAEVQKSAHSSCLLVLSCRLRGGQLRRFIIKLISSLHSHKSKLSGNTLVCQWTLVVGGVGVVITVSIEFIGIKLFAYLA